MMLVLQKLKKRCVFFLGFTEIWTWISGAEVQRSNQYTMELPDKQGYA